VDACDAASGAPRGRARAQTCALGARSARRALRALALRALAQARSEAALFCKNGVE
jgi:hypothetical protein